MLKTFDDYLIVPKFSTISSRKECDTTSKLDDLVLDLPIISSNMDTVTEEKMACAMREAGGLGALHRFCSIENNVKMFAGSPKNTFVSIGVGPKELERAQALLDAGARNFIIDVANGASLDVANQYKHLRRLSGNLTHIMVGNFATAESIKEFVKVLDGVQLPNSFKVAIGGGSMCTTRIVTGIGIPTLSSVMSCVTTGYNIVADGGIRNSGDIAKALAAGASAVMVGGLLAGSDETPGKVYARPDGPSGYKIYRGSASKESYEAQGKTATHRAPEGDSTTVPYKGPVAPILQQLKAGLQSSMSYVNARTLTEFKENAKLVEVSGNSVTESHAHGIK